MFCTSGSRYVVGLGSLQRLIRQHVPSCTPYHETCCVRGWLRRRHTLPLLHVLSLRTHRPGVVRRWLRIRQARRCGLCHLRRSLLRLHRRRCPTCRDGPGALVITGAPLGCRRQLLGASAGLGCLLVLTRPLQLLLLHRCGGLCPDPP